VTEITDKLVYMQSIKSSMYIFIADKSYLFTMGYMILDLFI